MSELPNDDVLIGTDEMIRIADCSKPWLYKQAQADPNFPLWGGGRHIKAWRSRYIAWLDALDRRKKSAA